jgi:hypothetical protein
VPEAPEVPKAPGAPEALEVIELPELPEATLQSLAFEEHPEPLEDQAQFFGRTGVLPCCTVPFLVVSCRSVAFRSHSIRAVPFRFRSMLTESFQFLPFCSHAHHALHVGLGPNISMLSHVVSCRYNVIITLSHIAP